MFGMQQTNTRGGQAQPGWYGADPTEGDMKANPHPQYHTLRTQQPVNLTPKWNTLDPNTENHSV